MHDAAMVPKLARPSDPEQSDELARRRRRLVAHSSLATSIVDASVAEGAGGLRSRRGKVLHFRVEQTSAIFGAYEDMSDAHTA